MLTYTRTNLRRVSARELLKLPIFIPFGFITLLLMDIVQVMIPPKRLWFDISTLLEVCGDKHVIEEMKIFNNSDWPFMELTLIKGGKPVHSLCVSPELGGRAQTREGAVWRLAGATPSAWEAFKLITGVALNSRKAYTLEELCQMHNISPKLVVDMNDRDGCRPYELVYEEFLQANGFEYDQVEFKLNQNV